MYEIQTDIEKNLLYVKLSGFMEENEVKSAVIDAKSAINSLRPSFDAITDITNFKPVAPSGRGMLLDIMKYVIQHKVNRVIRIVGNTIGQAQFTRASKEAGYTAYHVKSLKQAEELLNLN
jgi:hypothetical protein